MIVGAYGNAVLAAYVPILPGQAFELVSKGGSISSGLATLALILGTSQTVRAVLQLGRNFGAEVIAQKVERDIRDELYVSLLGKSMSFHSLQPVGDTMAGDLNGPIVLENLWEHVTHDKRESSAVGTRAARNSAYLSAVHPHDCATESAEQQDGSRCAVTSGMVDAVTGLLSLGMRNFLWFWRNPMLLQWRRGVRGLEYCTLYVLIREIEKCSTCGDFPIQYSGKR